MEGLPEYISNNVAPFSHEAFQSKEGFLNSKMKKIIHKEGLGSLIDRIEYEAFNTVMEETGGRFKETAQILQKIQECPLQNTKEKR